VTDAARSPEPRSPELPLSNVPLSDLAPVVAQSQTPLMFATVSGAHLYGFPSQDSDIDLRGAHVLPIADIVGLRRTRERETTVRMWKRDGLEMDLVTHDVAKFAMLLLRPNGYVLEQLVSPLVVHTTPFHQRLTELAPGLATSTHVDHYRGFADNQRRLFGKTGELKPLLYIFRTLLTGIHLMRSGEVQADLTVLADLYAGPERGCAPGYLPDLIEAKAAAEHSRLAAIPDAPAQDTVVADIAALFERLDDARERTGLPAEPTVRAEVDDLVTGTRIELGDVQAFVA
jgi:uncharacterized protein